MSEWISVEDRLPEDGKVITFSPPNWYRIVDGGFVRLIKDATHWMPLPEPPEALQEKGK